MNKRTKSTNIPFRVKSEVYARDHGFCIFCGRPGYPEAHYISRTRGGLGIPENIVTACRECHRRMDASEERPQYLKRAKEYLDILYPDFTDEMRIYKKGV